MQINQEVFMLVAQEMSISRAAEKACVTQQCVSDHIKRLEQLHQVKLFTRRPRFQLTEAGETMLRALCNMQAIERAMNESLKRRAQGVKGCFTLGIGTSRARTILPVVLPEYAKLFPEVEIDVVTDDTVLLTERLKQGKIDLLIGVNTGHDDDFLYDAVCDDEICLIISDKLLRSAFGDRHAELLKGKVNLKEFEHVPFSHNFSTSTVSHLVRDFLNIQHISLNIPYRISDTETQISLCASGLCAVLCPRMLLTSVRKHNLHSLPEQFIHAISLGGFYPQLRVETVILKSFEAPRYITVFCDLLKKAFMPDTEACQTKLEEGSRF